MAERPGVQLQALERASRKRSGPLNESTRLDLALVEAGAAIKAPGGAGRQPVVILLTDGLPNRVPPAADGRVETTIAVIAEEIKGNGVRLITIGLRGPSDINVALMRILASTNPPSRCLSHRAVPWKPVYWSLVKLGFAYSNGERKYCKRGCSRSATGRLALIRAHIAASRTLPEPQQCLWR